MVTTERNTPTLEEVQARYFGRIAEARKAAPMDPMQVCDQIGAECALDLLRIALQQEHDIAMLRIELECAHGWLRSSNALLDSLLAWDVTQRYCAESGKGHTWQMGICRVCGVTEGEAGAY